MLLEQPKCKVKAVLGKDWKPYQSKIQEPVSSVELDARIGRESRRISRVKTIYGYGMRVM